MSPVDPFERLRGNIDDELTAQNGMQRLGLNEQVVDQLADAIAVNVNYLFDVRWAPPWNPHRWSEQTTHFTECVDCGWLRSSDSEGAGTEAFEEHRVKEHGTA